MAGKRHRATTRVTVREEVSVMEVYWQLILWTGCTRFVGHDTLPSRPATGKPTRDVLRRRTESNLRSLYQLCSRLLPRSFIIC